MSHVLGFVLLLGALTACGRSVEGRPRTQRARVARRRLLAMGRQAATAALAPSTPQAARPAEAPPPATPCPRFQELRFTEAFLESFGACYWEPAVEAALAPPSGADRGDCCYGIAFHTCR